MKKGNLFILSGPSGVGKTAVANRLKKIIPELRRVITTTTRKPRQVEKNGRDYNFVTEDHFQKKIDEGDFLEWANVHGHRYGTPKSEVKRMLNDGNQILLIIDVQGSVQIKKTMPDAHLIFVEPESIEQLKKHLLKRPTITPEDLKLRLENAQKEIGLKDFYDFRVVSEEGKLQESAQNIADIITSIRTAPIE